MAETLSYAHGIEGERWEDCAAGGQASTPQALRARTLAGASSPARSSALGREPGRRLRLAQERMQAAVQAAEADRSETYSGRSTEDTEVRSQSPLRSFLACSDQHTCQAEEGSLQACPSVLSSAAGVHLKVFCLRIKDTVMCLVHCALSLSSVTVLEDGCYDNSG